MKLFITAGEPSGDALGAALIEGLKALDPDVSLRGVAGPRMQQTGMTSLYPMEELSVMGIAEVLPKYFPLKRRIQETADAAIAWEPDAIVTIDSPDFSLRVARRIKARRPGLRTVHYVAPTVWAWRPKRAERMARVIDHVLALFPFEPPYMEAAGMSCDFVGHPVAVQPAVTDEERAGFRADHGMGAERLLALLPGSRRSEVSRLMPIFAEALKASSLRADKVILPTLPHLAVLVEDMAHLFPVKPIILTGRGEDAEAAAAARRIALASADLALAASGTISLELAAVETPMVIAYDMAWLSRQIIQRRLLIDTVTLVNLVSDTRSVPEFIGQACTAEAIAGGLDALALDASAQRRAMELTMERLGRGKASPGLQAARSVFRFLDTP